MDRKSFIKNSSIALALALVPGCVRGDNEPKVEQAATELEPKIVRKDEGDILNVIGDLQTHKIAGADTDNQIVEWVNEVSPGVGIPPHIHTKEDEIFRVLKGQVELTVGDTTTVLKEGDVAFAPKNVMHAWKIVGSENASMSTSAFPAGVEHMFSELNDLPPGPPDFEKVAAICEKYGIRFV
ncbi:MAG: cupin domain-containing protein [Pricia sp.]